MNKRAETRLAAVLDRLPPEIRHLRGAILDIARQDSDLLGCGEADTRALEEALRERNVTQQLEGDAAAEALRGWRETMPDLIPAWAAAIAFVEGFLRGEETFGASDPATPQPPPPKFGLQQVTLEVPPKMRTKLYANGLALSNREVQIIMGELEEWAYKIGRDSQGRAFESP